MNTSLFVVMIVYLAGVQATCDSETINKIKLFWKDSPPKGSLQKMVGIITWLTAPSFYINNTEEIACAQTIVETDGTARDIVIFIDESVAGYEKYKMTENEDGILTLTADSLSSDEKLYVIYLNNGVLAYYQCQVSDDETYTTFAGVGVINASNHDIETSPTIAKGLKEADAALDSINLAPLPGIDIKCKD
uniref:Lipocalin/cytosolic fatty-acid binding domain-containing protein n=1 Tax=Graphocephala atropunctata TaxID=36148 RepID=A0A1B6MCW3_9HEMI